MNLAIRGFAADLGKEPADTFHRDQHPDLRADYVLANPPDAPAAYGRFDRREGGCIKVALDPTP